MILSFDTSTPMCSVALWNNGKIEFLEEVLADHSHSDRLFDYVKSLVTDNQLHFNQLEGIIVGLGPGSYTGLRVSASAAKGFAYAHNIPVYGISSLHLILSGYLESNPLSTRELVITAIDARRMEVYASGFCADGTVLFENKAVKVDPNTWSEYLSTFETVSIAGVGVSKLKGVIDHLNLKIIDRMYYPSARYAFGLMEKGKTSKLDLAYFEPYYVKEFGEK